MTTARTTARAVALLFLANGLAMSWLPRLPQVKDAIGADAGTLGLALLGTGVGGILGSLATPRIMGWVGPRRAAVGGAVVLAVALVLVGVVGAVSALFVVLAVMGLSDGIADIGQNHLMFEVQRTVTRSLTSRMHAVWSIGALVGTGAGTLAAALGIPVATQLVGVAVVAVLLVGAAVPTLRRAGPVSLPRQPRRPHARRFRVRWSWAAVIVAGLSAAMIEGVANEWSALTLRDGLGTGAALAGAGPTVFAGAMLVGRVVGDRGIDAWGRAATARAGAWAVAAGSGCGLGAAVWTGQAGWLLVGLVVAGVGTATLFPSMLAAGDRLDGGGTGVAVASSSARVGFLVVPAVMGGLAELTSLTTAFLLLPLTGVVAAVALPRALGAAPGRRPVTAAPRR